MGQAVLQHPEETKNTFAPVEGLEVSQAEVLAAVERAAGKKFTTEEISSKDQIAKCQAGLKAGNQMAAFGLIQVAILADGYGGSFHDKAVPFMAKLGVEP